jgi:hypothetical protein
MAVNDIVKPAGWEETTGNAENNYRVLTVPFQNS